MSKILAVDDDPALLQLIVDSFAPEYDVIDAGNGKDAVDLALKETPDLILMDVKMPVMNGIQATRVLKENLRTRTIPIIILTGLYTEEDAIMGLDAGASDYIGKPFDIRLLDARIRAHLRSKALYSELEQANKLLSKLDSLKYSFVAMAAHELNTPLNIINGYLEMLIEDFAGPLNPEQTELLSLAIHHCKGLADLVREMLDISIIESGRVSLELKRQDIAAVIGEVIAFMKDDIHKKELCLNLSSASAYAFFDCKRVKQVLVNLLSNAIKFTPPKGMISVEVRDCKDEVQVIVSDTGRGIPREALDMVFDEFYRCDRREEGTGLGLAICKRLVGLHGGRIWAESEEGKGSAFHFTLPKPSNDLENKSQSNKK